MKTRLLYPFSGIAGIFFPVGKPEDDGTCQFYTTKCLLACAAIRCNPKEFEQIGHEKKKALYDFIVGESIFKVLNKITQELKEMECTFIYWFASGDCTTKDKSRILKIVEYLSLEGIIQCGYTRSKDFWSDVRKYTDNIALTLESYAEVQKTQSRGLFAIPNYKKGKVEMYRGNYNSGTCGASVYTYKKIERKANCLECYANKQGCFFELP